MFALYTSYPVQMFPVFGILENMLFNPQTSWLETKRNILRTCTVMITILVAVGIPHFGLFMSLIGSLGGAALAFILPTLFHLRLFWGQHHPLRVISNILIILFGIAASAIATTVTVIEIIDVLKNGT